MVRSWISRWGAFALPAVFIALVAFTGLLGKADSAHAYGNGDGTSDTGTVLGTPVPLSEVFNNTFEGDYVSAGVGMRDTGPPGNGTIDLPAIPGTATVQQAFMYWAVMDDPPAAASLASVTLNGNAVTGTLIGTTEDPCWSGPDGDPPQPDIHVYVADVTGIAVPGASNNLTDFASGGAPGVLPLLEGASIVLLYDDPGAVLRTVIIHEGAVTFTAPPTENTTFQNFDAASGTSRTTYVMADGQPGLRNKTWVDGNETADFVLDGSSTPGTPYWDDLTQDISTYIPANDTEVTIGASSENFGGHDCLTWVGQVLSVPAKAVITGDGSSGGDPVVGGVAGLLDPDTFEGRSSLSGESGEGAVVWQAAIAAAVAILIAGGMTVTFAWSRRRVR